MFLCLLPGFLLSSRCPHCSLCSLSLLLTAVCVLLLSLLFLRLCLTSLPCSGVVSFFFVFSFGLDVSKVLCLLKELSDVVLATCSCHSRGSHASERSAAPGGAVFRSLMQHQLLQQNAQVCFSLLLTLRCCCTRVVACPSHGFRCTLANGVACRRAFYGSSVCLVTVILTSSSPLSSLFSRWTVACSLTLPVACHSHRRGHEPFRHF